MSKLNFIKKGLLSKTLNNSDLSKIKGGRRKGKPGGTVPPTGDN